MPQIKLFPPSRVRPLPAQPRKRFRGIDELAASIAEVGQSMPGIVTLVADDPDFDAQLIDGERRLRACLKLKRPFRAEVREDNLDANETFVASFAANFGKQDHDCVEIAQGLARMHAAGKTVEQLAAIAGKSQCWVYQHLSLNSLHPDVQSMLIPADDEDQAQLALSVAFLLVPLPLLRQLASAKKAIGMSMTEARRHILTERRKSGLANPGNVIALKSLASATASLRHRVGVFIDLPGSDFKTLIASSDRRLCAKLIEQLEDAQEDLESIRAALEKELVRSRKP